MQLLNIPADIDDQDAKLTPFPKGNGAIPYLIARAMILFLHNRWELPTARPSATIEQPFDAPYTNQ